MRNTPLLVQIFVIFFGLPSLGVRLSPLVSVMIALVANNAGYIAEIVRAGIQSTHRSQIEAAESLGMTLPQTLRFVVLPPALEKVLTPMVSQCVLLMLSTSLVSAIGVEDLTGAGMLASAETFRTMEVYLVIALVYVGLNFAVRAMLSGLGLMLFKRSRRKLFGAREMRSFGATELLFIAWALRWTLTLTLIAFLGGDWSAFSLPSHASRRIRRSAC